MSLLPMRKVILPILLALTATVIWGVKSFARADGNVSVWWPENGVTLADHQPFKAVLNGRQVTEYEMFWQVDGGHLNPMADSFLDYPHKEAYVDLKNWNWKGTGPYDVNFVAKDKNGDTLSQSQINIYTKGDSITATSTSTPVPSPTPTPLPAVSPIFPTAASTITKNPATPSDGLYQDIRDIDNSALPILREKIFSQPQAKWFGNWNSDIRNDVFQYTTNAQTAGKTPVLVAYNIPNRDCGGASVGGSTSNESYRKWIGSFSEGIVGNPIIIIEPDAIALTDCLSADDKLNRYELLAYAVKVFKGKGAKIYLDAGHARWHDPDTISERLKKSGIENADGFSLNVSNFISSDENIIYGNKISARLGGKHYVIDTSRNGNGSPGDNSWCNPPGRALGERPVLNSNNIVDGFLWIKRPGESDGNCNGGPAAGIFWEDYAKGLAERASW